MELLYKCVVCLFVWRCDEKEQVDACPHCGARKKKVVQRFY